MIYKQEELQPEREHTAKRIKTVLVMTDILINLVFEHPIV